ncbi:hypothetical protein [Arcticibacterium luteifluviistationis]|uniref:Uncharacterized protein n=1 Tax=Arcticibacterium luteifluviistationis TaxID=1784714 RepID=A0A2Z4G712_9BACT|nr:hypothetical protein [Arcticibacterium luteifluviistationis]AWV96957.1 hypothetical protein DJ013_01705 [Arcticibacterium luteifluviistationis]
MKTFKLFFIFIILSFSCEKKVDVPAEIPSDAKISSLEITQDGVPHSFELRNNRLIQEDKFIFGNREVTVSKLGLSAGASSTIKQGDVIKLKYSDGDFLINVTSKDGTKSQEYEVFYYYEYPEFNVTELPAENVAKTSNKLIIADWNGLYSTPLYATHEEETRNNGYIGWQWVCGENAAGCVNKNPAIKEADGFSQNISFVKPLIDVYDAGDKDYLQYTAILMKMSGIDIVSMDNSAGDTEYPLTAHPRAFKEVLDDVGLEYSLQFDRIIYITSTFGVNTEEDLIAAMQTGYEDFETRYFSSPQYHKINGKPFLSFGSDREESERNLLNPKLLNIFNSESTFLRPYAYETISALKDTGYGFFYLFENSHDDAFFNNIYGNAPRIWEIQPPAFQNSGSGYVYDVGPEYDYDETSDANTINSASDYVYLRDWNDYRRSRTFEPSVNFGYEQLMRVIKMQNLKTTEDDLKLATDMYLKRKAYLGVQYVQKQLDQVYQYLKAFQLDEARELLSTIPLD